MKRLSLIDADSIVYIVAYNHQDDFEEMVLQSCDSVVDSILTKTQADYYIGFFSGKNNFRDTVYKYAKYKGTRPPKPEWFVKWERTIKDYLITKWGFYVTDGFEADDALSIGYSTWNNEYTLIFCSPDKDIKQIPGLHFDYRKMDSEIFTITPEQASYNYYLQLLTGDADDNVVGIPGLGPVKAAKVLEDCIDGMDRYYAVRKKYLQTFGEYYGEIILEETQAALKLLDKDSSYLIGTTTIEIQPVPDHMLGLEEV